MQLRKTRFGLPVFDQAFGGVYYYRPMLVRGRRKSGKSILATHFIGKTLQAGERIILFTDKRPEDVLLDAKTLEFDFAPAVSSGQLLLISYRSMQGARGTFDPYAALPLPAALDELEATARQGGVRFAVFDTVVPWVAATPPQAMPGQAEDFVSALERLGLTSIILMPQPASDAARALADKLDELCPIVIELEVRHGRERSVSVVKYQGNNKSDAPMEFTIELMPGKGFAPPADEDAEAAQAPGRSDGAEDAPPPAWRALRPLVAGSFVDFSGRAPEPAPAPEPGAAPETARSDGAFSKAIKPFGDGGTGEQARRREEPKPSGAIRFSDVIH